MSSKQAEKEYLERTGGAAWEREKPFSPADSDTFGDSITLLHDFAVAVQLLEPRPTDRILDLGAGGGWCTDLLQRINRTSVAVDISVDMLRVGHTRGMRHPFRAAAGDMEHLPFVNGAFDKAICLNALHHIPDIPVAVREISRVLTSEGTAVFSEPGVGHSDAPGSVAAVRDFGVLEQEVLLEPFMQSCLDAGFVDVRVCPVSYAIPEFQLSVDEWRAWQRLARQKRPVRAAGKLMRAAMELLGLGKKSVLFEEAFAMRLVRLFQQPVLTHPFVVASKSPGRTSAAGAYAAALTADPVPGAVAAGTTFPLRVGVRNTGRSTWTAKSLSNVGTVRVGIQLLDAEGRVMLRDFARADLPKDVAPGESASVSLSLAAPAEGRYQLKCDMLAEGVTWFEQVGSPVDIQPLVVTAASPGS